MTSASQKSSTNEDTIVAIITPPGEGGIAAIRLAGRRSLTILTEHFRPAVKDDSDFKPFLMRYGFFVDDKLEKIDEILAVFMPKERSYTGLEQIEIFSHGGSLVVKKIQEILLKSGARAAEPGEFTKLAFLSGRIDLSKAEAVAEIIEANTQRSYDVAREHLIGNYSKHIEKLRTELIEILAEVEASIDFPEEEIDPQETSQLVNRLSSLAKSIKELADSYSGGRIINEGFKIAIAGRPNAGKSSLFNLLLKQERALVTPTPGTTRDYLSEWIELGGQAVNIIDTAGLRSGGGVIEKAGQSSAKKIMDQADLIIWMADLSQKKWVDFLSEDLSEDLNRNSIILGNKIDKVSLDEKTKKLISNHNVLPLSCLTSQGVDSFKSVLVNRIAESMPDLTSGLVVTSARHMQKLNSALDEIAQAKSKLAENQSPELTALDLRQAANELAEITGRIYNEDILGQIFSKFCIGK
ncbi:MAG: tRNA uridine-5-carboxymethylaminomethyl(34) synthesis GTPase MnmE [candidate division Zixibacteria bacterium]|nr:tRNA uridine-5-carboxymethylaminomethyl(34) synthesis GTPase MnmE [candidate division Zixibacteria bacterium]